jgi:ABC-type uncharacterized transport system permease subunit
MGTVMKTVGKKEPMLVGTGIRTAMRAMMKTMSTSTVALAGQLGFRKQR